MNPLYPTICRFCKHKDGKHGLTCPTRAQGEAYKKARGWEDEGGVKFDQDKPRMDLLDGYAIEELAKVLTFGAKKYAPHNWRKGIAFSRLLAASARHLFAIMRGENLDEETGLHHAAHLMCCAMFLVWTAKYKPDMDDRYGIVPLPEDFKGGHNND